MRDDTLPVLEAGGLAKRYNGREAVRNVSFTIRRGEILGLLGPNGAGKTTTLGMAATVIEPSSGFIRLSGASPSDEPTRVKTQIGLVPQTLAFYPSLSAEENLRFFGKTYGLGGKPLEARIEALLDLTGLAGRRQERVALFSGGMQRRLNLACGLVHEPKLLLLDEPTVGVDPQSREHIFAAVEQLARSGTAILYTTHYMEEAERLCHRVAIMDEGRFVAEGTVAELAGLVGRGLSVMVSFKQPPSDGLVDKLRERGARRVGPDGLLWSGEEAEDVVSEILHAATSENNSIRELSVHRPDLGEVFLHLTGKGLRD